MVTADKTAAIRQKAEALAGQSLGEQADLLVGMAAPAACAHCQRPDIPEEMEQAVAMLALTIQGGEGDVKSITRGDTAITYANAPANSALAALNPWRRLAALKEA